VSDSKKKTTENEPENSQDKVNPEVALKEILKSYPQKKQSMVKMIFGLTTTAINVVTKTGGFTAKVSQTIFSNPERKKLLEEAGSSLHDLREVAGLTVGELSDAIQLPDKSLLTAVENGTATLSFELILRLAALLARHDPVPFILKFTRTYSPEVWSILEDWGLGRLPLHIEREREFINIYRSMDAGRRLSDEQFTRVLGFTRNAFETALAFAQESIDEKETAQKDTDSKGQKKKKP
jgi:transcriptional regulator with XRE-family HTH domain